LFFYTCTNDLLMLSTSALTNPSRNQVCYTKSIL